jgi:EAL domain-containing protein (putative c-di-GMP-specific phosphodiesterase class I)
VLCLPEFATQLHALLVETRLPPQSLELEIVTLYGDISEAGERALQQLKNCGVRFTLSAASPACAHLAWTRRLLPLDGIEVPSRLVDDVAADPEGVAIIRALVTRAHKLGLSVCAKDVGASRTASVMVATGCDLLQGALFGSPARGGVRGPAGGRHAPRQCTSARPAPRAHPAAGGRRGEHPVLPAAPAAA